MPWPASMLKTTRSGIGLGDEESDEEVALADLPEVDDVFGHPTAAGWHVHLVEVQQMGQVVAGSEQELSAIGLRHVMSDWHDTHRFTPTAEGACPIVIRDDVVQDIIGVGIGDRHGTTPHLGRRVQTAPGGHPHEPTASVWCPLDVS